jgi:DUF4097 and DUF4098 domain-containing protein YvlB
VRIHLLMLALVTFAVAARADEWKKEYPLTGTPELRVESGDGGIEVKSWDQRSISARVVTEGYQIGPGHVRIDEHQDGNNVQISVHAPHTVFFGFGHHTIRIELLVPRQSNLDLHSSDGHIALEQVQGTLRLDSSDGRIEGRNLDGSLRARTSDGAIRIQGRFDNLELHTGDGHVDAEIAPHSRLAASWSVSTSDGSVNLRLPADLAADLDARTGDGHIRLDFPVTVSGSFGQNKLRGKINGGGPLMEIRTGDGNITLEKI